MEGAAGTQVLSFRVTLSAPSEKVVSFQYTSQNGKGKTGAKTSDGDYSSAAYVWEYFIPGETETTIDISVYGDTKEEADEIFSIKLLQAIDGLLLDDEAIGTILNDD